MTYTTQQLQVMSDREINSALVKKLGITHKVDNLGAFIGHGFEGGAVYYTLIDYCNNPSDIMPLAFERGISLIYHADNEIWTSYDLLESWKYRNSFSDKSPYRAAACIILLMKV